MKWINIIVKSFIVGLIALSLTGCIKKSMFSKTAGKTAGSSETSSIYSVNDPAVVAVVKSGKLDSTPEQIRDLLQKNTYYFGFDSNNLNINDYKYLNALAVLLGTPRYRNVKLLVEGNTDQRGTRNYNIGLGFRRANAVRDYLLARGINKSRFDVASYGFEKPADSANNPIAWQKNRRTEVVLKNMPAA